MHIDKMSAASTLWTQPDILTGRPGHHRATTNGRTIIMRSRDPALSSARRYFEADLAAEESTAAVASATRAAAELAFLASVPTSAVGAATKLRACLSLLKSCRDGESEITEIGLDYVVRQLETTIEGLTRPRVVWDATRPSLAE
jgi:hypothetical protein